MQRTEKNQKFNNKQKSKFRQKQENVKKGRLIIRNLSFKTTEQALTKEFEKFGNITEINILKKPDGKLVGCAFLQYEKYQDSINAIKQMNGKDFLKRKVTVDFSVSKNRYKSSNLTEEPEIKTEDDESVVKDEIKEETVKDEEMPDSEVDEQDSDDEQEENIKQEYKIKSERKSNDEDHEYTIFIKKLSFETTNEDLQECFKKYGPIKYALVVRDPISGHSKGTAFVRFLRKDSVNMCLQQTGLLTLQNSTLEIFPSLTRQKIKSLDGDKKKVEPKDSRNMYLLREGMVLAGSAAAEGVSATDMSKRLRLEQIKSSMLKNLNRFLARERLTIHNLPEKYDDEKLRKLVAARTGLKPIECRIMRENAPTAEHPKGKPKGFGFLSFKKHEDALTVLRKLNNNPDVFSTHHRPIVSFSIEDKKVLNIKERRQERSKLNNPTYQEKIKKVKQKKLDKKQKLKAPKVDLPKAPKAVKVPRLVVNDEEEAFSGFTAKPGPLMKLRGTFRLKEQSKIHEKSMKDRNKKAKREKLISEMHEEKKEKKLDRTSKKRKIDSGTQDSLTKMIDKYKNMINGDDGASGAKKTKIRGKWFIE